MKRVIVLLLLLSLMAPAMSKPRQGYLVVIELDNKYTKFKTESLVEVYTMFEMVFPQNCICFEKEFSKSSYFEMYSGEKGIYVEKKRITERGKYRRIKVVNT